MSQKTLTTATCIFNVVNVLNTQRMVSNYDDKSVLHNHKNSQHVILGSPWFLSFILDIVNNRLGFWPRSQLH